MDTIKTLSSEPFRHFVSTIGALPTSFTESMSYYELLAWLCNYLQNTVIPAVNDNAEALAELQQIVKDLKEYVENYFENLDVQTEINNKLDEMAESGELTDIIAQYLGLAGVLAYDTVAALAAAENLANGSIAKTLGMISYSDGLGAFYKIRTITNVDVIDGYNLIAITNDPTLVAERLLTGFVTPEMFGAVGDGTTNDYDALQAFLAYPIKDKRLKAGVTYAIEGALTPASNTTIEGNGATIKRINATVNNRVLYVDAWGTTKENIFINNVVFDGDKDNATQSLTPLVNFYTGNEGVLKNIVLSNCAIQNVAGHGIGCYNDNSTTPVKTSFQCVEIKNCTIKNVTSVGIQQATVCTTIDNCNISTTGAENITIDTGCEDCLVNNCQITAYGHGGGIGIDQSLGCKITNCYIDGTNNTATSGYQNGITINAATGVNYNTIIAENIFANNDVGIRIGSGATTIDTTAIDLTITGNTFKNSTTSSVFVHKTDGTTKVYARGNAYDKAFNFDGGISVANIPKCYNIDYPVNLWNLTTAETGFTLTKAYTYLEEGIIHYDLLVTANSATLGEGWTAIVNFGVNSKYNIEYRIPTYTTDMTALTGMKDAQIYNDQYLVYWVANEAIKCMIVKGSFPVA